MNQLRESPADKYTLYHALPNLQGLRQIGDFRTIQQIADLLEVHKNTVSKALNGHNQYDRPGKMKQYRVFANF